LRIEEQLGSASIYRGLAEFARFGR
jgi:hypothetical protein